MSSASVSGTVGIPATGALGEIRATVERTFQAVEETVGETSRLQREGTKVADASKRVAARVEEVSRAAFDRARQLPRYEGQDFLVRLAEAPVLRIGLHHQRAEGAIACLQWNTHPVKRPCAVALNFALPLQLIELFRRGQQRLARAQYILRYSAPQFLWRRRRILLIHKVGES